MATSEKSAWREVLAIAHRLKEQCGGSAPRRLMELAADMLDQLGAGVHTNPARRKNPALAIWGNPGKTVTAKVDQDLSHRAIALSYKHVDDDNDYEHDFARGVHVVTVESPSGLRGVLLYRPDGRNLWDDFEV